MRRKLISKICLRMEINDFSALIQLTATLTIAFVAVEYVKSYTRVVCNRIFSLAKTVTKSFKDCVDSLTDDETLNNISAPSIGGRSTNNVVQQTLLKNGALRKNISDLQKEKLADIGSVCRARSMSSLCFFLFMSNTLLLFLAGLERCLGIYTHIVCVVLCVGSVLYLVIGWCLGEKSKPLKYCNFTSLKHPIYSVICMVVIAAVAIVLSKYFISSPFVQSVEGYWWVVLLVFVVISYVNFIMFVGIIWYKARRFLSDIYIVSANLKKDCVEAQADINDVLAACRLQDKLESDGKLSASQLIPGVATKELPGHPRRQRIRRPFNNNLKDE